MKKPIRYLDETGRLLAKVDQKTAQKTYVDRGLATAEYSKRGDVVLLRRIATARPDGAQYFQVGLSAAPKPLPLVRDGRHCACGFAGGRKTIFHPRLTSDKQINRLRVHEG
jgi:hypothetical protein